uniref:Large ribosomal subunit protein uL22 n=1 Tax=candidate division CPR3 bacterium TaxID=2268181 RepID=A0A7C5UVA2_UNCC3
MDTQIVYAKTKNFDQPPRKVRLVVDLVRGKKVDEALLILEHLNKKASNIISKVIRNAAASAVNNYGMSRDKLYICDARVDEGMKRVKPFYRARGTLNFKTKRMSHITIGVCEMGVSPISQTPKVEDKSFGANNIHKYKRKVKDGA